MKKSPFKRILDLMKGVKLKYTLGIIGMSVTMLVFQTSIALLFLNLFNTLENGTFSDVLDGIMVNIIVMLVTILITPIFVYMARSAASETTGKVRTHLFDKITKLPLPYFKARHSAEVISVITNDVSETERAYSEHLINFLSRVIMGLGTLVVMFLISWQLALLPVGAAIITIILNTLFAKRLRSVSKEVQEKLATLNTKLSNILSGINVIRVFNIQTLILKKFFTANKDTLDTSNKRIDRLAMVNSLNDFTFTLGFAGIALIGSYFVLEGFITIGVIIAIVQLQNGVSELVRYLGNFMANLQSSLAAGERVFELLDEKEEDVFALNTDVSNDLNYALTLEDVEFAYEDNQSVINALTLAINAGDSVALVGPSGGGKSTVFKLLLQFYQVDQGKITLNLNEETNAIKTIRNAFAYVPQDAYLFNTTIKENIAYGMPNASMEAIIDAAEKANAHTFIMALDDGYDTTVGEQGAKLSGGQRQRIAIARAIIKGAPILLLDEATSALDNESELLVQNALEKLMKDKTSIVIAHRLSTIEHADNILVISEGKVQEQGTHESLLKNKEGIYTSLYQRQLRLSD